MLLKGLVGRGTNGMYKGWNKKDANHRRDCEAFDIFSTFRTGADTLPLWRLRKDDVNILDMRVRSMWWPHYTDKVCKKTHSFWTHSDRMWKSSHKYYILMVLLPTCLHGFVPAVHNTILMIVYALRRLAGQVLCKAEAQTRGVLPGSPVIDKDAIPIIQKELMYGLVLLEGIFPPDHLNPAMHHLAHYAEQTSYFGILQWLAMFSFERNNRRVKGLVRNSSEPLSSLANNLQLDITTRAIIYAERPESEFEEKAPTCFVYSLRRMYVVSARLKRDLGILGITAFDRVRAFNSARILGVHFRANEWGRRRCGSVITTIYGGRSRYCVVKAFLRVQGKSYAHVLWLSKPNYPYAPNKLVVRVRMLTGTQQLTLRCVVRIEKIDPCSVAVIPHVDGVHFFMLRNGGYDRTQEVLTTF